MMMTNKIVQEATVEGLLSAARSKVVLARNSARTGHERVRLMKDAIDMIEMSTRILDPDGEYTPIQQMEIVDGE